MCSISRYQELKHLTAVVATTRSARDVVRKSSIKARVKCTKLRLHYMTSIAVGGERRFDIPEYKIRLVARELRTNC
jgi:hypothetical protein